MAEELREEMSKLGFRRIQDMVGHVECLDVDPAVEHWKARGIDFSDLLRRDPGANSIVNDHNQDWSVIDGVLDTRLLDHCKGVIEGGDPVEIDLPIQNTDRTVGTILGSEISRKHDCTS